MYLYTIETAAHKFEDVKNARQLLGYHIDIGGSRGLDWRRPSMTIDEGWRQTGKLRGLGIG